MAGEVFNEGLLGKLAIDGADSFSDLICSLLEPNFPRIALIKSDCPKGSLQRTTYQTKQSFCDDFNKSSPEIQNCWSDAALRVLIYIPGTVKYHFDLGKCCTGG